MPQRLSSMPWFKPNDDVPPALARARVAWVAAHTLLHLASDNENQYLNVARLVRPLRAVAASVGRSDVAEELERLVQTLESCSARMILSVVSSTAAERMNKNAESAQVAARRVVEPWLQEPGAWVGVDLGAIKGPVPEAPLPTYDERGRLVPRRDISKARSLWDEYQDFRRRARYAYDGDDSMDALASGAARRLADLAMRSQRPDLRTVFLHLAGDPPFEGSIGRLVEAYRDDIEEWLLEEDERARAAEESSVLPRAERHSTGERPGRRRRRRGGAARAAALGEKGHDKRAPTVVYRAARAGLGPEAQAVALALKTRRSGA